MLKCNFCDRTFKNTGGLATHEPYCPSNPNRKIRTRKPGGGRKKGSVPWNKGLTQNDCASIARPTLKGKKFGAALTGHTNKTKEKLSKIAKDKNFGGYVEGSGRGNKGWYKGFFCDSSWELAYVVYCLDHNIAIKRNIEKRSYIFENVEKNYIPDFIVEGELVEIKGYKTKQWEAKLACNPDVKVLYEKDLQHVFDYVINIYGKDFTNLYE